MDMMRIAILPSKEYRNGASFTCSTIVENPLQIGLFLQNKANVKIGKLNISIATIKDYDKKQRIINNERYSKQSQSKPILKIKAGARMNNASNFGKTNPNKANVGSLGNLFDHIEIFVFKTKLKILILQDRLDILLINEALRLIR